MPPMPARTNGRSTGPMWRQTFDAVERPVARASEAWVQSDVFMNTLAVTWKVQRRLTRQVQGGVAWWFGLWDLPTGADVRQVAKQVASLERQVRELARELERTGAGADGKAD